MIQAIYLSKPDMYAGMNCFWSSGPYGIWMEKILQSCWPSLGGPSILQQGLIAIVRWVKALNMEIRCHIDRYICVLYPFWSCQREIEHGNSAQLCDSYERLPPFHRTHVPRIWKVLYGQGGQIGERVQEESQWDGEVVSSGNYRRLDCGWWTEERRWWMEWVRSVLRILWWSMKYVSKALEKGVSAMTEVKKSSTSDIGDNLLSHWWCLHLMTSSHEVEAKVFPMSVRDLPQSSAQPQPPLKTIEYSSLAPVQTSISLLKLRSIPL